MCFIEQYGQLAVRFMFVKSCFINVHDLGSSEAMACWGKVNQPKLAHLGLRLTTTRLLLMLI